VRDLIFKEDEHNCSKGMANAFKVNRVKSWN
jgi:hypothetical protein